MPCEVIPCTVNNSYIVVDLEFNQPQREIMYKERIDKENKRLGISQLEGITVQTGRKYGKPPCRDCCEKSSEGLDEKFNPKMLQKEVKCRGFGYRTLPIVFSTLGDFGVIQETESPFEYLNETSSWCLAEPRLQQNHPSRRKTRLNEVDSLAVSSREINRRRRSEGLIVSGRRAFGLVEYRSDSKGILNEQRSERDENNTDALMDRENNKPGLVITNSQRASVSTMNAVPESRSHSQRYYSLPRKLSLPVENHSSPKVMRVKQQRNSVPTNSSYLRNFASDNHTEIQWERLVARARTFQIISTKEPETSSKQEEKDKCEEVREIARGSSAFHRKGVDVNLESTRDCEEVETKENSSSVETREREKSRENHIYSVKHIENDIENSEQIETKENSDDKQTEEEAVKPGQVDLTLKNVRSNHEINTGLPVDRNSRRYSLATVRPPQEVREQFSGYSTHRALEYAKIQLGKIQTEGKTKSKKERLDDMSKALKIVLEELNRIELPDRDLVSIFISLRANIVNLKAELKAEEKSEQSQEDNETKNGVTVLSKTLPKASNTSDTPVHSRRFSWC